jgi:hypothetical protein
MGVNPSQPTDQNHTLGLPRHYSPSVRCFGIVVPQQTYLGSAPLLQKYALFDGINIRHLFSIERFSVSNVN